MINLLAVLYATISIVLIHEIKFYIIIRKNKTKKYKILAGVLVKSI
jgi:hypothetical protein